jgi:hypothetical protein
MSASPLPTGDAAWRLELAHLYVTTPVRLNTARPSAAGQAPAHAAVGGVSCDRKGWLFAWVAYVPSTADAPTVSVWPVVQRGGSFDVTLPGSADLEVLARTDTPERAVGRLARHLESLSMARIVPDIDYLRRAVAAYRAELRRERDRAAAQQGPAEP